MNPNPLPINAMPLHFRDPLIRNLVRNRFGIRPIAWTGDIERSLIRLFRVGHPRNGRSWTVDHLRGLFWDMELQELENGFFYKTRAIMTALLNVHRHMVLWSDPQRYLPGTGDTPMFQDFRGFFQPCIWNAIMANGGPMAWLDVSRLNTGRDLDQVFIREMSEVLRVNEIEGTDARYMTWDTPRTVEETWTPRAMMQPQADMPILLIPPPVMTRTEAQDGPYNYTAIWMKPAHHWHIPDHMW